MAGQAWLADAGELAGPVTHAFNNFLNIALLQAALLEPEVPERLRSELVAIRQQGTSVAAMVKLFQQYRQRPQPTFRAVDLNALVSAAAQGTVALHLMLDPGLPPVHGFAPDLNRLVTLLLTHAALVAEAHDGAITVRTGLEADHVSLRVEGPCPDLTPELLSQLFEPGLVSGAGRSRLELAACRALVRRLQGSIQAESQPAGGIAITVKLPVAPA